MTDKEKKERTYISVNMPPAEVKRFLELAREREDRPGAWIARRLIRAWVAEQETAKGDEK